MLHSPPRQRVVDLTCANGSAGTSFRHRIPVQVVAVSGGAGATNPPGLTGDGRRVGSGVGIGDEDAISAAREAVAGGCKIGESIGVRVGVMTVRMTGAEGRSGHGPR